MDDLISRQMLLEYIHGEPVGRLLCDKYNLDGLIEQFPSVQPECSKEFVMLKVRDLNGRPYYSIIYLEEGCEHEGYASYDLMVISEYLKRYFGFAQPEIIHCKDCKWSDWYDAADGHRYCYCMETGAAERTADDFCSYAECEEVSE